MKFPVVPALAALLFATIPLSRAQDAEAKSATESSAKNVAESLTEAELDEVIAGIRAHFIKGEALSPLKVKVATVQGLLEQLAPGVAILNAAKDASPEASPFRSEILEKRIGYVRLGATSAANLVELDKALAGFAEKSVGALVLDLRATPAGSQFDETAEVCRRLVAKGKVLFRIRKRDEKDEQVVTSKEDPRFRGVIVVLVDRRTGGNAEVIAAVLRSHVNAMIIGQTTRGEAVQFQHVPLASGKLLRVAVAEVTLPDNVPVFPGGVKPDIAVEVAAEVTDEVLKVGLEKGVTELVYEQERARMNEAALVAGTNPDLDAAQAAQKLKGEKPKPPLRDAVLQRAVDFITTLSIYEKRAPGK